MYLLINIEISRHQVWRKTRRMVSTVTTGGARGNKGAGYCEHLPAIWSLRRGRAIQQKPAAQSILEFIRTTPYISGTDASP